MKILLPSTDDRQAQMARQLTLFNSSSLEEAGAILTHGEKTGFFSVLVQPAIGPKLQRSYRVENMPQVLRALDPKLDSYLSQAIFCKPNRRLINLWHLPLAFVDLDTHTSCYGDLSPDRASRAAHQYLADQGIPPASLVIHSGRGLYLKWLFRDPLPKAALPRWNVVQKELTDRLLCFGADPRAKDASRVLRLVQTTNTKQRDPELRKVRVLWVEEVNGRPLRHPFEDFADEVLPFTRRELEGRRVERKLRLIQGGKKDKSKEKAAYRFNYRSLHWDRLTDMLLLIDLRGVIPEGDRHTHFFLTLNSMLQSKQITLPNLYHEAREVAHRINPNFRCDSEWTQADIASLYHRAKEGEWLHYRNETLIDQLKITPDEERRMKTLISKAEKRRRFYEKREQAREARLTEKAALHFGIVGDYKVLRMSYRAIAKKWGVSHMTVKRVVEDNSRV